MEQMLYVKRGRRCWLSSMLALLCMATAGIIGCTRSGAPGDVSKLPAQKPTVSPPSQPQRPSPSLERLGSDTRGFACVVVVAGQPLVYSRQLFPVDEKGQLPRRDEPLAQQKAQAAQLRENLRVLLEDVGSGWDKIVRVHGYVVNREASEILVAALAEVIPEEARPALTLVETALCVDQAQMALDVVAIAGQDPGRLTLLRSDRLWGEEGLADAAVVPVGGFVYFSGYPERGEPAQAIAKSWSGLLDMAGQLTVDRKDIVQIKSFLQPIGLADLVKEELRKSFVDQLVPPLVFAEWIATAPVEIEMVSVLAAEETLGGDSVRFYNPPWVKPSPTFSRAALITSTAQIFTSGLLAEDAPDGTAEVRSIVAQLEQIIRSTGSDMRHLVKATYYVSDKESSTALDKLRPEIFDPARPPAASKVTVQGVAAPGRTVVVDMIAIRP